MHALDLLLFVNIATSTPWYLDYPAPNDCATTTIISPLFRGITESKSLLIELPPFSSLLMNKIFGVVKITNEVRSRQLSYHRRSVPLENAEVQLGHATNYKRNKASLC